MPGLPRPARGRSSERLELPAATIPWRRVTNGRPSPLALPTGARPHGRSGAGPGSSGSASGPRGRFTSNAKMMPTPASTGMAPARCGTEGAFGRVLTLFGPPRGRTKIVARHSQSVKLEAEGLSTLSRYHRRSRACSSVDRASASGAEGRRFESCRARQCHMFPRPAAPGQRRHPDLLRKRKGEAVGVILR
jgi:hypothetical protein